MKQSDYIMPPLVKRKKEILENFGVKREDYYYWLKDKNNPEVIEYLNSENKYKDTVMDSTKEIRETIYNEIVGRMKEDNETYPYFENGYYYYSRTKKGEQYSTYLRKKGSLEAKEEVLLDINKLAEGENAYIFEGYSISPNNRYLAYTYNTTGSYAEFTLKVIDLETGNYLDFSEEGVDSFVWANDNETLIYCKIDRALRPSKIYRHNLNEEKSELMYEEKDEKFRTYLYDDSQNKFIYLTSVSSTTSEERFIDANDVKGEFNIFLPRVYKTEYSIIAHVDSFIVKYKNDEFPNRKLYKAPFESYNDMTTWTEIVKHNKDVLINEVLVFKKYIVTTTSENGLKNINIININDNYSSKSIIFPEASYNLSLDSNPEFNSEKVRYEYSSLKRPYTLYEYDINLGKAKILKVQEIPTGFNSDDYVVERLMAPAQDGTKVPLDIIYKKGLQKNGENPALIYAYGSYGYSTPASFNSSILSLVDRGFVFAMAQIRGGSQMGEYWYQEGKLLKKKNTFTDFIDCTEYLISEKYTTSKKIAIMGGSAGGLLMGAVANMRPDLYNCVLALVPFVDVVTTMLDDTLPLTTGEYEEWGNPNEKEYFEYMLSYSPYDNIEAKDYPNMLVTGGLNDSQVLYHEPAKYTAKLRNLKTDNNVLIMHMDMESGHGGATGRYNRVKDIAFEYAFILKCICNS